MQNDITRPPAPKKDLNAVLGRRKPGRASSDSSEKGGWAEGKIALGIYEWEKVGAHKWRDMGPQELR